MVTRTRVTATGKSDSGSLCHGSNPCEAAIKSQSRSAGDLELSGIADKKRCYLIVIWF
jgi:hypothetical protein